MLVSPRAMAPGASIIHPFVTGLVRRGAFKEPPEQWAEGSVWQNGTAKLEGEEGDEQFWFEGGSDADRWVRVEIQGAWLQNLPWHRAA
jgi:hypothetical protein